MASIRPQDLVFTLFGEYLLRRREAVPVAGLIRLLAPLGLSEADVRTVLSRMVRKGWLVGGRGGRRGRYGLSAAGRRLLEVGEARIYRPRWDEPWDGHWYVLAYSIPEDRRRLRDGLRVRLAWLGFGSLGNGLWISPHDVDAEVRELAEAFGLQDRFEAFRGPAVAFTDPAHLVRVCWDLPGINRRYERFIRRWAPLYERDRTAVPAGSVDAERCFVQRFRLMHEYREFPLLDPYLPRVLLPSDWGGECAAHLFRAFHDLLVEPADAHVAAVLAAAAERSGPASRARRKTAPAGR